MSSEVFGQRLQTRSAHEALQAEGALPAPDADG